MAVRKNLRHDEKTRAKIQTSQLINRLTAHALGEVEMSTSQVRAAEVLIRKTLPDLSAVDMNHDATDDLLQRIEEARQRVAAARKG
jgi:hypothetical protein